MKNYLLISTLILLGNTTYATDSLFRAHIKLDLKSLNEDSLVVEISLFDSFLGSGYKLFESFNLSKTDTYIEIALPEISLGTIEIKNNGKVLSTSGSAIFNGDTLFTEPGNYYTLNVKGGGYEAMQENFALPFNLPSLITNNKSFKAKMVQRSYDLEIPENPMLQAIYKEYLRNVLTTVRQNPISFQLLMNSFSWENKD